MLTVMYLIDTLIPPPGSPVKGGAESQLYQLISSLNAEIFKAIVVQLNPGDSPPIKNGQMGNAEVFHLPTRRFYSLNGFMQLSRLCSIAKARHVDIIHTFFEKSEVLGWLASRFSRIPIWITSRRDLGFKRKEIYNKIFRIASRNCDKCIANCRAVKTQIMQKEDIPEEKIEVIHNGLDFSEYQLQSNGSLRTELGIRSDIPLIGMIANFHFDVKGHGFFLASSARILEKFQDCAFLLVGDGPLRKKNETLASELGIKGKVHFLGRRNDVPSIISNLDISVLSSTSEGLSNVILESMAAGVPVVVTDVGGSGEVIENGVTGYLVPPADPEALADAITKLIENPGKAKAMGAAGKKVVHEKFSIEAMVKEYEDLYKQLLEETRG